MNDSSRCFWLTILLSISLSPKPLAAEGSSPPSILLLTIDTLREDGIPSTPWPGYFGTRNVTPFLSDLARTSVRFTNAHSTSSWTVPAVASLLSGLYAHSHGVVHGAVNRGIVADQEILSGTLATLPEELQKRGYKTFGVTANAHLGPDMGYGRGFDRYLSIGVQPAEKVNETLLKWKSVIEASPGPVFIWVHYYDPHHPYVQHEPWFTEFAAGVSSTDARLLLLAGKSPPTTPRRIEERSRFIQLARSLYDSEIRYLDGQIADLYRRMPFLDSCLTVITGDHGEEFLEHGGMIHCRNLYAETVRVPLLLRLPRGNPVAGHEIPSGECPALVSLVDVPATLLLAAGGSPPATWAGISLFEAVRDPTQFGERQVIAELERNRETGLQQALIGSRMKLIRIRNGQAHEFYDVAMDHGETRDLAVSESAQLKEWADRLDAFLKKLPPPPEAVERRGLTKEAQAILKGEGYIH